MVSSRKETCLDEVVRKHHGKEMVMEESLNIVVWGSP